MSLKSLDKKGRWRSLAVAFRMSPEENADLEVRVRLSGLTKQDYILRRLTERDIVVQGSPRVYKALRNQMTEILEELRRLDCAGDANDDFLDVLRLVTATVDKMEVDQAKLTPPNEQFRGGGSETRLPIIVAELDSTENMGRL